MPPEMAVSMRHTKIKAEEAALLAGEITKPSWESRNEGIHERVSFEDSIWGFDLAGGIYYKTPLRVTYVKPDSRAEKAGIRPGDRLKRINDIDTSTLTIQEAHDIIVESGVHLKLAVTAPEDEEDAYFCYEDPIDDGYDSEEERRREEERARKRVVHARVSSYWSLQWPWVSKRRIIYRESNCFMVPSKFEDKHRDKFPVQSFHKIAEDLVLDNLKNLKLNGADDGKTEFQKLQESLNPKTENLVNGTTETNTKGAEEPTANGNVIDGGNHIVDKNVGPVKEHQPMNLGEIPEVAEDKTPEESEEESIQEIFEAESENIEEENSFPLVELPNEQVVLNGEVESEKDDEIVEEESLVDLPDEQLNDEIEPVKDDEVIQELLNGHDESILDDEEKIIDSILNENNDETNETDER